MACWYHSQRPIGARTEERWWFIHTVEDPGFVPGRGQGLKGRLRAKRVPKKKHETSHFACKMASWGLKRALSSQKGPRGPKKGPWSGLPGGVMAPPESSAVLQVLIRVDDCRTSASARLDLRLKSMPTCFGNFRNCPNLADYLQVKCPSLTSSRIYTLTCNIVALG